MYECTRTPTGLQLSTAQRPARERPNENSLYVYSFLTKLLALFIFLPFLSNVESKREKENRARSSAKKNRPSVLLMTNFLTFKRDFNVKFLLSESRTILFVHRIFVSTLKIRRMSILLSSTNALNWIFTQMRNEFGGYVSQCFLQLLLASMLESHLLRMRKKNPVIPAATWMG